MNPKLLELEEWLASLEPPRFPTESEIDLWDFLHEIDQLDAQARPRDGLPPEGGDALDIFADSGSDQDTTPTGVTEN